MVDNDLVGLLGIYAMRDIGRYMKTATRKMICPLSSRQVKYLNEVLMNDRTKCAVVFLCTPSFFVFFYSFVPRN